MNSTLKTKKIILFSVFLFIVISLLLIKETLACDTCEGRNPGDRWCKNGLLHVCKLCGQDCDCNGDRVKDNCCSSQQGVCDETCTRLENMYGDRGKFTSIEGFCDERVVGRVQLDRTTFLSNVPIKSSDGKTAAWGITDDLPFYHIGRWPAGTIVSITIYPFPGHYCDFWSFNPTPGPENNGDETFGTGCTATIKINSGRFSTDWQNHLWFYLTSSSCTNECEWGTTQYRCSGDVAQKRTCGNYDQDRCSEWSPWEDYQNCNDLDGCYSGYHRDYYCANGSCTSSQSCTEECCDKYHNNSYAYCLRGICHPPCTNECSLGAVEYRCSGNVVQRRTCGNYDEDPCSEWSPWEDYQNCDDLDGCSGGYYGDHYCFDGSCKYSTSCTETCCDEFHGDKNAYCSEEGKCYPPPKPPTASFSCDSSQCPGGDSATCIMYQPTSESCPCIFKLKNNSTASDGSIYLTRWYIKKQGELGYRLIGSCSGKCDHTIQITDVPDPGIYTVQLFVQDSQGLSSTTTKNLIVKREIKADFVCSLNGQDWKNCQEINVAQDEIIYVKNTSSLSEGASNFTEIIWQKGNGTDFTTFSTNSNIATTSLTIQQKVIRLFVRDNNSRCDRQDYPISVSYPLPKWREIPPLIWIEKFLAGVFSYFNGKLK